jgi:hypothetical protein
MSVPCRAAPPRDSPLTAIASASRVIVTCQYDPTGRPWVWLRDSPLLGWNVDPTGAAEPMPTIVGAMRPS